MKFESDKNPLRAMAVLVIFFALGFFYLFFCKNWAITTVFNLVGILSNASGALWIASGVYLLKDDKKHLESINPSRNKGVIKLTKLLIYASKTIPLGLLCIFVGSLFQAVAVLLIEFKVVSG